MVSKYKILLTSCNVPTTSSLKPSLFLRLRAEAAPT